MIQFYQTLNTTAPLPLRLKITAGNESETYVSSVLEGKEMRQILELDKPVLNNLPRHIDYGDVYLMSDKIKTGGEDAAPYRVMGATIGANHGYKKTEHLVVGHSKTAADIGSKWNDGTNDVVLVNYDGDYLYFSREDDNSGAVSNNFTHISGATNQAAITSTSFSVVDMYPPTQNYTLVLKIDGAVQAITDGVFSAVTDIVFEEVYEIMDKPSIMDWLIANVGTITNNSQYGGTSAIRISNTIRYTRFGNTLKGEFEPLASIAAFQDIMFVMGFQLAPSTTYPNLKAYIPQSLPFSQDGNNFDFANIQDVDYLPLSSRVDITPARAEATGVFCDRHIYLLDGLGVAMGYLPVYDADPAVRRSRANNKALQLQEAGKIYMSAIDDDGKVSLEIGDNYKVIAYKNFFKSTFNRTAYYFDEDDIGNTYLYADWHNLPYEDALKIPSELIGKTITLIDKSSNVSYSAATLTASLLVSISNTKSYGFLILKIT